MHPSVEWLRARHAEGRPTNPIEWDRGGLLTVAVRNDWPEILCALLDYGFDPDEHIAPGGGDWVAYSQDYPLRHCAALGRREMALLLLERGANRNAHVDSSGSAVYSACSHKQWDMVELLRAHGGIVSADIAAIYRQTGWSGRCSRTTIANRCRRAPFHRTSPWLSPGPCRDFCFSNSGFAHFPCCDGLS